MVKLCMVIALLLSLLSFPSYAQNQNDLPTQFDIVMLAGADYLLSLKITDPSGAPINVTGYQFAAQFREAPAPSGTLFATYSTSIVSATAGQIRIKLSKARTMNLTGKVGLWDLLQIDSAGRYSFLVGGKASVRNTVTR